MRHRIPMIFAALALLLCTTIVFAQAPQGPPKPGPEVMKLAVLIGNWTTSMDMKPFMGMPGGKGTSTTSCAWIAGGFGVSCKENADMGAMGKGTSVSMFAYDAEAKNYIYCEVSSDGETVISRGVINGDTWVFDNDSPMQGKMMHGRFTANFTSKTAYDMKFEIGPDANSLQLIMTGKAMHVKAAAPAPPKPATK
jgi:hypothetical protein